MKKLFYLIAAVVLIVGCAKDGDTGPQGPAGSNGTNGTDGTNGTNGTNGNANVHSKTFSVAPGDWNTFGTPGQSGHCKWVEKPFSEITQSVYDFGGVYGFVKDGSYWSGLPYTGYASTGSIYMHPMYRVGYFEVDFYLSTLGTPNITTTFEYKAVIVDGTARAMNSDLDWKDYNAVASRFNLEN